MRKLHVNIGRTNTSRDKYTVDYHNDMTVLNVLETIYEEHDSTIAYRFSCRTGLCTRCMMMINGKPRLSCMKKPNDEDTLHLAPLPKGETIKDRKTPI